MCACEREGEGEHVLPTDLVGRALISTTASFYKVLFVLCLGNAGQEVKTFGSVKHTKGKF